MNKYFNGYTGLPIDDTSEVIEIATTPLTRITTNYDGDYYFFPNIHKESKNKCKCSNCYQAIMDAYWEKVNGEG